MPRSIHRFGPLVSERLEIPTIGIGAGLGCDGQVLVTHDLLGLFDRFTQRFVKKYADLHGEMACAISAYKDEVEAGEFPGDEHSVEMLDEDWKRLEQRVNGKGLRTD